MDWLTQNSVWLLIAAALAFLMWRRFMARPNSEKRDVSYTNQASVHDAHDPVTGNKVDAAHAITANFEGKTFFFESESSRTVFQQNPERFAHQHHRHHGCC
ncbi:YHS domain-containing protein [Cupriavidus basilensis]|uniref:YHS domain-containing protein n=1 Tax=Cupriavidus basilensis TaxID=68895 RepID=UPI0023E7E91E|nr:YHS domain-containing protein [Cupriavidus basilensis]MDF3883069.1 YHS domain-containing protein [Cupriavidus basilensis]